MKKEIILEILKKLNSKPVLVRKLKILAVVSIIGFFLIATLTIWAGVTVFNYTATKAKETIQNPVVLSHVNGLKTEIGNIPKLQTLSCWSAAQSLIAIKPWLEKSAADNFVILKSACLSLPSEVCKSEECDYLKKLMHTAEGKTI